MASPSTVITQGYGSFGSSGLVLTLGYGLNEPALPGGRVYATVTLSPRVCAVVNTSDRVSADVELEPRVFATLRIREH